MGESILLGAVGAVAAPQLLQKQRALVHGAGGGAACVWCSATTMAATTTTECSTDKPN